MKLSRKSEYTILTLIDLSRRYERQEITSATVISSQNNIPRKFLDQILNQLKQSGYIKSIRGSNGGYILQKSPREICIAEVIRLIDGPLAPISSVSEYFYQNTPSEQNEKLLAIFKDIRDYTAQKLETHTFADLI